LPTEWDYGDLAADVRSVADATGAGRALGVSMGAAALCRLLAETPDRFERLVFFLPAVLDPAVLDEARMASAQARVEALRDPDLLEREVTAEVPERWAGTPTAAAYIRQRVAALRTPGVAAAVQGLPSTAVDDASVLAAVTAPALVLACRGDAAHPIEAAERLAAVLPSSTLHVYPEPGVRWNEPADLRARIAGFFNQPCLNQPCLNRP
jgi:3-oxoadipate enol-lactonase